MSSSARVPPEVEAEAGVTVEEAAAQPFTRSPAANSRTTPLPAPPALRTPFPASLRRLSLRLTVLISRSPVRRTLSAASADRPQTPRVLSLRALRPTCGGARSVPVASRPALHSRRNGPFDALAVSVSSAAHLRARRASWPFVLIRLPLSSSASVPDVLCACSRVTNLCSANQTVRSSRMRASSRPSCHRLIVARGAGLAVIRRSRPKLARTRATSPLAASAAQALESHLLRARTEQ